MKPSWVTLGLLFLVIDSGITRDSRSAPRDARSPDARRRPSRQAAAKIGPKPNRPYQPCVAPGDKKGHCRHFRFCPFGAGWTNSPRFVDYLCVIENSVVGVCCPDDFTIGPQSAGANIVAYLPASGYDEDGTVVADGNGSGTRGCGMQTLVHRSHAGARRTEPKEWPWMAALLKHDNVTFCGGVLITDQHVLTAAHCTTTLEASDIKVRLGEYDFGRPSETRAMDFAVARLTNHEGFDPATYEHDIAVLALGRRTTFNSYIWPICLPPAGMDFAGVDATVTGWGRESFGGPVSPVLMEVSMPVWANDKCAQQFTQPITDNVMCAAAYEGGRDSCQGDSGGPLQYRLDNGRWANIGVVSWGIRCGMPGRPGVYTRVNKYLTWIVENTF